ncbi:hypothetical protein CJU90_4300 [Yarrowia sp. C11]|nr:hypothetical protein CKK34_6583 [Yarrowia sp. E02]KAG5365236.1 hypothetical protein CJU90_4300 [Yarrowia sp. C11]
MPEFLPPPNCDMSSYTYSDQEGPIELSGVITYLKIQLNRLGALARYYDVRHLQYDQMEEPARTDLGEIARKIIVVGESLIDALGSEHPMTEQLCKMTQMVGQNVMSL